MKKILLGSAFSCITIFTLLYASNTNTILHLSLMANNFYSHTAFPCDHTTEGFECLYGECYWTGLQGGQCKYEELTKPTK